MRYLDQQLRFTEALQMVYPWKLLWILHLLNSVPQVKTMSGICVFVCVDI